MQPNDFFIAGGTLRPQAPSYVKRPADDALLDHLLAGEFCYVLTPRQMGKSSLMVRTAARLRDKDIQTVIIDLTSIGSVSVDEWYLGLLSRIRTALRLDIDVQEWWQAQAVGTAQRFSSFLHDEVLGKSEGRIVIFIDEIDSTLNLDFRDDFFAAVRALYNARANESIYQRITFAFLGVATPTELIQDRERTPFNIGQRIDLQEFTLEDARPLQDGLESLLPEKGETLLRRIFHWTSGHPYLTQKLCLAITIHAENEWDKSAVDQLVAQSFLSEEGRKDTNLAYVQDRILSSPSSERRVLITLYRQVYNGRRLPDDDRSPVQNRLELYGLLKVKHGVLHLRNEIYRQVFNSEWIAANTPVNSRRRTAIGAVVIALLLVSLSALFFFMQPTPGCDVFVKQFLDNPDTQTVRMNALASLFEQSGRCDMDGLNLFYDLPKAEQKKLFLFDNPQSVQADLRTVVEKLSRTLDWSEGDNHDQKLMEGMIAQLQRAGIPASDSLVKMLQYWHDGRILAREKNFNDAISEYEIAMAVIKDNPALLYDRAVANVELENYTETLKDLDELIRITQIAQATPTPTPLITPTLDIIIATTSLEPRVVTSSSIGVISNTVLISSPQTAVNNNQLQSLQSQNYKSHFRNTEDIIQVTKDKILEYPHLVDLLAQSSDSNLAKVIDINSLQQFSGGYFDVAEPRIICDSDQQNVWFEGHITVDGQPANGYQVVFKSTKVPGLQPVTSPSISGSSIEHPNWPDGYYAHIVDSPVAGSNGKSLQVWVTDTKGYRISAYAYWKTAGNSGTCNHAVIDFYASSFDFSGVWNSNFSELHLTQNNNRVTGNYNWYGDERLWQIEGTIKDKTLRGHYMNDTNSDFVFSISNDGNSFDGYWLDRDSGKQIHWCGVRNGALPEGCGFSGTWLSRSNYCYDRQPTIELTQNARLVFGTFDNGNTNGSGIISGTIGGFGDGSQFSLQGDYVMTADGFQNQFRFDLVDLQDQQFIGWWQNEHQQHPWCGWRNGLSEPSGCGVPANCVSSTATLPPSFKRKVELLSPTSKTISIGTDVFAWKPNFRLSRGEAFELIFWKDGQDPMVSGKGWLGTTVEPSISGDLFKAGVPVDTYLWGVLLVQTNPYKRIMYLGGGWKYIFRK